MRFAQLTKEIFCKPCLINPLVHQQISRVFLQHVTGEAPATGGLFAAFGQPRGNGKGTNAKAVLEIVEDIAIINISGPIVKRYGSVLKTECGMTDIDDYEQAIRDAEASPRVRGILLHIDSPGGTVTGTPEFGDMVANTRKPVVAFTDTMMDSAAYWVGAGADMIVATPSSQVGSIGVYMAFLDASRAYEMAGFEEQLFKTGTYKGMGYPGTALTEDQKALLQAEVDEIFEWFKAHVNMHRQVVGDDTFEGQDFGGAEAKRRGLVDEIGDFDFAVEELRNLIELRS